jgi:hypothetical protein
VETAGWITTLNNYLFVALVLRARTGDDCPHPNLPDSLSADLPMRADKTGTTTRSNARGHE